MPTERRKDCADCKAELVAKIGTKVDKGGVWKFVTVAVVIIIAATSGGYGLYAGTLSKKDAAIEKNEDKILAMREIQVQVVANLKHLKEGQTALAKELKDLPKAILDAIKESIKHESQPNPVSRPD